MAIFRRLLQRFFLPLLLPGILLPGIYVLLSNIDGLGIPDEAWQAGPYVVITVLLTMSAAFNRSRIFYSGLILSLLLALQWTSFPHSLNALIIYGIFPVNMALILLYRERGIFTIIGLWRSGFILAQAGLLYFGLAQPEYLELIPFNPAPGELVDIFPFSPFNQITMLMLVTSSALIIFLMYWQNTPTSNSIFFVTLAALTSHSLPIDHAVSAFVMAASILLSIAILRDSYKMAYLDELTGLSQRRALNEHFMSLGNHYSIAMLDVDHFKKFNDTHGHDVGDQVLQMVAAKIKQVRGAGKSFRYGGEEFTIIFNRKDKGETIYFLEEVRKAIQNYEMVIREEERIEEDKADRSKRTRGSYRKADKKVSVTISIGVADKSAGKETPEDVLKKADEALYKAKKAGRNRVCESIS